MKCQSLCSALEGIYSPTGLRVAGGLSRRLSSVNLLALKQTAGLLFPKESNQTGQLQHNPCEDDKLAGGAHVRSDTSREVVKENVCRG